MRDLNFSTIASQGNFIYVNFGIHSEEIHTKLQDTVYYRKNFNLSCLADYSRFSATIQENFSPIISQIKNIVDPNSI